MEERTADAQSAPRSWVAVVSAAHVERGVSGGFAQACHGKRAPLARMRAGDMLVYYSPRTELGAGVPLRAFTALGHVSDERVYPFDMGGGFVPHRRDVRYLHQRTVLLDALASRLHFTQPGSGWGLLARRGHFEIDLHDAGVIAAAMGCPDALRAAHGWR
jgi:EVE domain